MFPNVLSTWIRGLLSVAILVAAGLLLKKWVDDLPRVDHVTASEGSAAGHLVDRSPGPGPLGDRLVAWAHDPRRSLAPLLVGLALLLLAFGGRSVSPRAWKRDVASASIDPDHEERMETLNGCRLHVVTFGRETSPPVILIHGLGSDHTQWLELIEDLRDRYHVIAYDILGHGLSQRGRWADHSLEAMAQDLDDVMRLANGRKVIVIGHSMGGMIALTWCGLNPRYVREKLAGLILVHTTPQNPFDTMAPVPLHRILLRPVFVPLLRLTTWIGPLVKLMTRLSLWNGTTHWNNELQLFAGHETKEQLDRTAKLATRMDPATHARFSLALTRWDGVEFLHNVNVPTLVVAADRDPVTVPAASETIADRVRGADMVTLAPAKHMGFMELRDTFGETVVTFARDWMETEAREHPEAG